LILDKLHAYGRHNLASQISYVDSAGINVGCSLTFPGDRPANETMMQTIFGKYRRGNRVAQQMNDHSSRTLQPEDFYDFDVLVCVDNHIFNQVAAAMLAVQESELEARPSPLPPACYLTCLGWFIDEKGKKVGKDIPDPLRDSFKGEKTKMKECWRKTEKYMRCWLGDKFEWDVVNL